MVRGFTPVGRGSGDALLWIHGQGLVVGAAVQDDVRCIPAGRALDIVVSVQHMECATDWLGERLG